MARAQGARAQMALAFETTYGTPHVGGFTKMPFASTSLGAEQQLLNSELLGYGRDPLAPIKDAVTADDDIVVPLDPEAFGFWLKATFGDPTTTGTGPWTHAFQSGAWTLPSMSIETGMPEVPRYAMYSGCVLDQINWQMQRSGLLTATARLVAQGETVGTTTGAGTPAALKLQRFGHFNGAIMRNGSALGNVVSADITYANNLDRIETIRSDGRIDGADPSIAALTGSIEVRFSEDRMMQIRNPVYTATGAIDCEVAHPQLGWIPFTASPQDIEAHGRDIFAAARQMGPADYVAPTGPAPEDVLATERAGMRLSFSQLLIGLVAEGWLSEPEGEAWLASQLTAAVSALIATLPKEQRFATRARALRPSVVERVDPLVVLLANAQSREADELDVFFRTYALS